MGRPESELAAKLHRLQQLRLHNSRLWLNNSYAPISQRLFDPNPLFQGHPEYPLEQIKHIRPNGRFDVTVHKVCCRPGCFHVFCTCGVWCRLKHSTLLRSALPQVIPSAIWRRNQPAVATLLQEEQLLYANHPNPDGSPAKIRHWVRPRCYASPFGGTFHPEKLTHDAHTGLAWFACGQHPRHPRIWVPNCPKSSGRGCCMSRFALSFPRPKHNRNARMTQTHAA